MSRTLLLSVSVLFTACAAGDRSFTVTRTLPFAADVVWSTTTARFGEPHRIHPHLYNGMYLDGADAPAVGVTREVWRDEDGSEVLHEQLISYDPENYRSEFAIVFADNVPVDTQKTTVESSATPIDESTTLWSTTMNYRLTPSWLATFAEGGMQSDMEDLLIGLEHHIATGEDMTLERFEEIEEDYR